MVAIQPLRVFGTYTIPTANGSTSSNVAALLEDVLLFEHVVVDSARLLEFGELVKILGCAAVTDLLRSGCLTVSCDCFAVGTNGTHHLPPQRGVSLPPGTFALGAFGISDDDRDYISRSMSEIADEATGSGKRFIKLKGALADHLAYIPRAQYRSFVLDETIRDLINRRDLVASAAATHLRRFRRIDLPAHDVRIELKSVEPGVFAVESNLPELGVPPSVALDTVRCAAHAIAQRTQRIADMRFHNAVSGFHPADLPLFEEKLAFLESQSTPESQRAGLRRVVEIANLPSFSALIDARQLQIDKLLKLRTSSACLEFRQWLAKSGEVPDEVVREMCSSAKAEFGAALVGPIGRTVSFLMRKALGAIEGGGPVLASLAGAAEQFLAERILKTTGPVTFLNTGYRSLYELPTL